MNSTEIKVKFNLEDLDEEMLCDLLEAELDRAKVDYIKKKEAKGEKVDAEKCNNAIGQRKSVKILTKLLIAKTFNRSNKLFNSPAFDDASKKLVSEVEAIINRNSGVVGEAPTSKGVSDHREASL